MNLKPIPGLPGYFASDDGHVYSTRSQYGPTKPRLLAERPTHDGYLRVRVVRAYAEPVKCQAVAPVIAAAFIGPRPEGQQVRHIDGNKLNNRPENLCYGSAKDNADDRARHGTTCRGERSTSARHSDAEVRAAVQRVLDGEPRRAVEADLGIGQSTLARWVRGESRRDAHPVATWRGAAA